MGCGFERPQPFELLTASGDGPAYDGCFTRTLTATLRDGIVEVPAEYLLCSDISASVKAQCPLQVPEHLALNPDSTLWLARNVAKAPEPWAQTSVASEIERLTLAYQPTPALQETVDRSRGQRCVAVVGVAGSGKSALAAALAWPTVAGGSVPAKFVHAIALITEATTQLDLARQLCEQLSNATGRQFRRAQQAFTESTPHAEQQKLGALERQFIGPLKLLQPQSEIRIVLDALDRLATGAYESVITAFNTLSTDPELSFVRLVVTVRPDTELPQASQPVDLGPAADESIGEYLAQRHVPDHRRPEVVEICKGSWLVARLLADQLVDDPSAASATTLSDVYEDMLQRSGTTGDHDILCILSLLAAAGAGPVLPLALLCAASASLGGPSTPARVRDHLVRLRGLVVRSAAGTEGELAGLFHQTLADHIAGRKAVNSVTPDAAHRGLAEAIARLAPVDSHSSDLEDPTQRYAFEREAEHWWALNKIDKVYASLRARISPIPQDNLRSWEAWQRRFADQLGPEHPVRLMASAEVATWIGRCGRWNEAAQLFRELLPQLERQFGPDDPNTLITRLNIAHWLGKSGEQSEALGILEDLLPRAESLLGLDPEVALGTLSNLIALKAEAGNWRFALADLRRLQPIAESTLGRDHEGTLSIRNQIAGCTCECVGIPEGLRLFAGLLEDQTRVFGQYDLHTLSTRNSYAVWTARNGAISKALRLLKTLREDCVRVLGHAHRRTLKVRAEIAYWTGTSSSHREVHRALTDFVELLPDECRVLGQDHPDTQKTRDNIVFLRRKLWLLGFPPT